MASRQIGRFQDSFASRFRVSTEGWIQIGILYERHNTEINNKINIYYFVTNGKFVGFNKNQALSYYVSVYL